MNTRNPDYYPAIARRLICYYWVPAILLILCPNLKGCSSPEPEFLPPIERQAPWVSAYLAAWQHDAGTPYSNWGRITVDDIPWNDFTHLIYFALNIAPDGTPGLPLEPEKRSNFNSDRLVDITAAAHARDKMILYSVGGAGNYHGFQSAIKKPHRQTLIATLTDLIQTYGFDGVDIDMEPIHSSDFKNYEAFIRELSVVFDTMLTARGKRPLLTIAALKGMEVFKLYSRVQDLVDQINIMTYDMAMPWRGWHAWHNSALYSSGLTFRRNRREVSSVDQKVHEALKAGLKREKIGIGIGFYGYVWHGVHLEETWATWPAENLSIIERRGGVPQFELQQRFPLGSAKWDDRAKTPYLNLMHPKLFVTFENDASVTEKIKYVHDQGLGGVIIWEIGADILDENGYSDTSLIKATSRAEKYFFFHQK